METNTKKDQLEGIFANIRQFYDALDETREKILPLQRQTIRICSEIIKNIHRDEAEVIPSKISQAISNLHTLEQLVRSAPGPLPTDYLQIVKQELGEAVIFYQLIYHNRIPAPEECHISVMDYAYACSDVVGEIRRFILTCLRKNNPERALTLLDDMSEMYLHLFTLDYPNGLIPGLRKKTDAARGILSRTEADVTLSHQMLKLSNSLQQNKSDN